MAEKRTILSKKEMFWKHGGKFLGKFYVRIRQIWLRNRNPFDIDFFSFRRYPFMQKIVELRHDN